ncbi:MICOS complex subunit mic25a-like isoform X2 [Lates japonicus]|uniref:MICOS complex subunit mic25a-like isoform X2 n=1 Tax=Lates japonicus TaxID=270547 RepID=A0AAD3N4J9_LATJO|nr:MICOS complex subunit mic25a-like isoform X2 [Lates japonicus]
MGANGSTGRKVSFGLDEEDEKVTVIEGVKLSEDVLRRMRESQGSDSAKPPPSPRDSHKPPPPFEHQQALRSEQLARLAQRRDMTGLDDLAPAFIIERREGHEKG